MKTNNQKKIGPLQLMQKFYYDYTKRRISSNIQSQGDMRQSKANYTAKFSKFLNKHDCQSAFSLSLPKKKSESQVGNQSGLTATSQRYKS